MMEDVSHRKTMPLMAVKKSHVPTSKDSAEANISKKSDIFALISHSLLFTRIAMFSVIINSCKLFDKMTHYCVLPTSTVGLINQ